MLYPDLKEFKSLYGKGNLIPVYREILADFDTPVSAFLKIGKSPSFLLESVVGGEKWARYSFLGTNPSKVIKGRGKKIEIRERGRKPVVFEADDPVDVLKKEIALYKPVDVPGLPRFSGGLVGYMGYDMVRFFERVPDSKKPGIDLPDMFFMLADTMLIFDSLKQKIKIVSNAYIDGKSPAKAYKEAVEKIDAITDKLKSSRVRGVKGSRGKNIKQKFTSSFKTKEAFEEAVLKSKEYIAAGDIFQVVLSQRFERKSDVEPFDVYRALRVVNPSPYMYYIDTGDTEIVGSSPEILVRVEDKKIVLRPIAGTRRRGETEADDKALEEELKKDPKEMAEHIMLVDLGRNDVGRVAEKGSVNVTELMAVERYSHVMHMVSNVEGDLEKGLDAFDVLRACFPAGTVTGAPKVRAMEIIDELEPIKRGPYAGSVGYFSYSGNMDTCITIRTLIIKDGKVYVQAGAGIVADSVPEREYTETVNKAMGMMKAVDMAERGLG
ncbi:MAG: anthranilate synthase component I [Nitrospirae bacterium GWF2_44_13]|nr:MAG: anthranilate synthase component I [Nitrospirae bacterium GWF2_44_13]OGW63261.1 MAG: anthranilate synthase component I [Nitrospirae bacterium RIFOXYA2_FULL_44_9]HBG92209.1 anthranilate synthase component I [Nitrospiraceae bacterium]